MNSPTNDDFEKLFVNNDELDEIRAHLARFNPITTMGMERMEIRHSAILAWLLDPQQTHGLGDSFLRAFLSEALRGFRGGDGPSSLDVSQADLSDAEVRREWKHIDLLVLSPRNGWIFVIENKFDSTQHSNQLKRYMEAAQEVFLETGKFNAARGIFLTLGDEDPDDDRFAPILYEKVCELLSRQVVDGLHPLAPEVTIFLRHYLEVLQGATGMNMEAKKLEKLARQLYRDNKRVLDFVVEHGKSTDFTLACDNLIGEDRKFPDDVLIEEQELVFVEADSGGVHFIPKSWYDALATSSLAWSGCETYAGGYPVKVYLRLDPKPDGSSGQIKLIAEVGSLSDHVLRRNLIEVIQKLATDNPKLRIGFTKGAADEGRKHSRFFKKAVFTVQDIHDPVQIEEAMKKAIKSYAVEIAAVSQVLPQFLSDMGATVQP